jgi:5-formyltetrahydrofolate cyclo-ligase
MENPDMSSKVQLRRHFRQQRSWISLEDRQIWSGAIANHILALEQFKAARVIFSYLSHSGEVATNLALIAAMASGKLVLTPTPDHRLLPEHGFHFGKSVHAGSIVTEKYTGEIAIGEIDLILVPGIVWDRRGHRIGFGGGYFDRLLAARRRDSVAIGLSYDLQLIDKIPSDPWDQAVDLVITQSGSHQTN